MVTTSSNTVMVAPASGRGPSNQAPVPWPLASLRTIRASRLRPLRAAAWATPLTSGSNAISGITAVGAIVVAGALTSGVGTVLGFLAMVLAMINVVGGFVVTHRMLAMFQPRKK